MAILYFEEADPYSPIRYSYEVDRVLCSRKTRYQHLFIFENAFWGRVLVLDNVVQLTERDEYLYHEMITHVALHAHPSPRKVLIIGGGDGGSLRETLKHDMVERATLVELDAGVIQASREFLPTLSTGFSDPRAELVEMNGVDFVAKSAGEYDVIIIDSTDPVGPAEALFSREFLAGVHSALKEDGIMVAQTESLHFHRQFVVDTQNILGDLFTFADIYTAPIATYAGNWWTFSIASKVHDPHVLSRRPVVQTSYYAEDVHKQAFLARSLYNRVMGR